MFFSKAVFSVLSIVIFVIGGVAASTPSSVLFAGRSGGSGQHGSSALTIVTNLSTGITPILAGIS